MERPSSTAAGSSSRTAAVTAVLLATVIVLAVLVVYAPGMRAGFYFDDRPNIVEATALHWSTWSIENIQRLIAEASLRNRLVANLSFAMNHLAAGLQPAAYHWTNLGVHLAVGAALVWVTFLYCTGPQADPPRRRRALLAALLVTGLFLLHPLNIQAVTYVVQRMAALATLFVLLAFGCYLRARMMSPGWRRSGLFFTGAVCWVLALGSKETALALPAVVLLYEASLHRACWRQRLATAGSPARRLLALCGAVVLITAVAGIYYTPDLIRWSAPLPGRDYSGYERVLTEARVQLFYLRLLVWPAPEALNLDHEFSYSMSPFEPATAVALAIWVAVFLGALRLTLSAPRYGFPLLAYLAFHAIESGPLNLELVFEHRMYLPMTMLAILGGAVLTDIPGRRWRGAVAVILVAAIALGSATRVRNQTWAEPIAFLADCARKSPGKFRPQFNLGTELGKRGRLTEAEQALRRALRIKPTDSLAHNQLGNVYLLTGRRDAALREYTAAVASNPHNAEAVYNLARRLEALGRVDEAGVLYRRFVEIAPPWLEAVRRRTAARLQSAPR